MLYSATSRSPALTPRTLSGPTEDRLATVIQCSEPVIGSPRDVLLQTATSGLVAPLRQVGVRRHITAGNRLPQFNITVKYYYLFSRTACQTPSDVAGMSICRIPRACRALSMALMTTG